MLTTFDKLFVFALHEEKCTVLPSVMDKLVLGLSGAILADLVLQGKVRAISAHKLELVDSIPVGDLILDEMLKLLKKSEQPHKVSYWIKHLVEDSVPGRKRMFERLVSAAVLSLGEDGFAWVTPYADSPYPDASAKFVIKSRLRELVLTNAEPDLSDLALLGVMKGSKLLNLVFTKGERKAAKKRIFTAVMNRVMNDPVAQALQEIEVTLDVLSANA